MLKPFRKHAAAAVVLAAAACAPSDGGPVNGPMVTAPFESPASAPPASGLTPGPDVGAVASPSLAPTCGITSPSGRASRRLWMGASTWIVLDPKEPRVGETLRVLVYGLRDPVQVQLELYAAHNSRGRPCTTLILDRTIFVKKVGGPVLSCDNQHEYRLTMTAEALQPTDYGDLCLQADTTYALKVGGTLHNFKLVAP